MTSKHGIAHTLPTRGAGICILSGNKPARLPLSGGRKLLLACAGLLGALAFGLPSVPAHAATATSTMGVSSTVQATCLNTITPLALANATATITVTCTNTTPYNIGLDAGLTAGATALTRQLAGPAGALLNYRLTSVSATGANWGFTVGTDTVTGVGTGSAQPLTIYGTEPANQYVTPGAFADTITATVTY
jgi:spore coat protein U-like protein